MSNELCFLSSAFICRLIMLIACLKLIIFSANSKVSNLHGHGGTVIEALPGALQDPFAPGQLLDPQMFI